MGSLWPSLFAFGAVTLAALSVIDLGLYVASKYHERYLQEAGTELDDVLIQMPARRIFDFSVVLSVAGAVFAFVAMSLLIENISWKLAFAIALIIGIIGFSIPRMILKILRIRRLNKFNLQLEDALNMISGTLKAGFSINQALEEVANQELHPISIEFRLLTQEIRLGVSIEQALDNMNSRLGSEDFELVATAIATARKTGGELTGVLERVAGLIRERVRIAGKIRALTAMGRLQATIIGAMPFLLLVGMYKVSPALIISFFSTWLGFAAMILVVILDIVGFLWIRKITKINV